MCSGLQGKMSFRTGTNAISLCNPGISFHKLLQSCNQFIDGFVLSFPDIACHASPDMVGEQFLIKGIYGGIYSGRLDQDVVAVSVILQHSYNAPYLTFNTLQPVHQLLALRFGTVGVLGTTAGTDLLGGFLAGNIFCISCGVAAAGFGFMFSCHWQAPFLTYPLGVSLLDEVNIYPKGVFVNTFFDGA